MEAVHVLACPDKFRGTLTAPAAAAAMVAAATATGATGTAQPLADGGEGTLDAFGGPNRRTTVTGPDGAAVEAEWRISGGVAVIEMARAAGMALVGGPDDNDAMEATTAGVGQLIAAAAEEGADTVIVGLGGSATTDGGLAALRSMGPRARYHGVDLRVACDVRTRFVDAAEVFGPQKGASPAQVRLLTRRLERLAAVYRDEHGVDVIDLDRAGAAGGLAGALAAMGATLEDGLALIADAVDLYDRIEAADLVVTGEGRLDATSFDGKVIGGVLDLARPAGVPVVAVVGSVADGTAVPDDLEVIDLSDRFGTSRARADTAACVREAVSVRLGAG